MLVLATILDNPGEPPAETRYRNPQELKDLGYTGQVVYSTTGLTGLLTPDTPGAAEMRQWVGEQYEQTERTVSASRAAGLDVWLTYDAPTLSRELVGSAMTCIDEPETLCPASYELMEMSGQCLEGLINQFDPVEGVVLRLGDSDAHRLPYLVGNSVYTPHCSRCGSMGRAHRLDRYIRFFYDLIVQKLGRKLVVRAWNVRPGGLHDQVDLAERVAQMLPRDDRLILSFKFTQTDFWRYQQWNPSSLAFGDHPIIYELECQREFEGKGAIVNYQPPLWRDGMTELEDAIGLADASRRVNLVGLWGWVRGGGWRGPYINEEAETWIDANVAAVPQLAADPRADVGALAHHWITGRLGCRDEAGIEVLRRVLEHSPQTVLKVFYIEQYARSLRDPWEPSGQFIRDDIVDAEAGWRIIRQLPESALDQAFTEKQQAVDQLAADGQALHDVADQIVPPLGHKLAHTMDYAETFVQTLRDLLAGLAACRRHSARPDQALARAAAERLRASQRAWVHHTQRVAAYPGTATAFESETLFDFTQQLIEQVEH